jgi:GH24 family phage-related lysozyme (muramidase)
VKLSPQGVHLIAGFEGFVPTPYNDAANNATIGYGHLIHLGPVTAKDRADWKQATPESLLALLAEDCAKYAAAVTADVHVRLGVIPARAQARFDALVSLCFNIGTGAFAGSSLVRGINAKGAPRDWTPLSPLWLAWDHAGGVVLPGLLNRRRAEFAIFRTGKYPT